MKTKIFIIFSIFSLAFVIVFESCKESNLDVKPAIPTEDIYFTNPTQFREGVLGIYSKLVYFYNYRQDNFLDDVRLLPDDDLTTPDQNSFEVFYSITSSNTKNNDYYKYLYQLVGRSNAILEQINLKGQTAFTDSTDLHSIKGEIYFLRAFGNFMLWNMYGSSPLVTSRPNEKNFYPKNSSGTELLDQSINDLSIAVTLLPAKWGDNDLGRATKGSGYALLGKAYLYRGTVNKNQGDFQNSVQALSNVTGYTLTKDFSDNFNQSKENNSESVFEVQLGGSAQPNNPWLDTDTYSGNGDISGYWGFFDNNFGLFGIPVFSPTKSLISAFDTLDPRFAHTIANKGAGVKKYVEFGGGEANGVGYFNNARIIRFSDVKLLNAEAIIQSGGSASVAIALINDVRKRARESKSPASLVPADRDLTETNKNTILKWIIEERRLELAFEEGNRWFDLKRWHRGGVLSEVYGKDLSNWDFSSKRVNNDLKFDVTKNLVLPIPLSEIQLNTNLTQNPNY